ncbi:UNVERIFIED_CONTAM: hypothetical protein Slati_4302000 [Sesamum latifolium]|uniref:RNase H type-1 domain-containing protein n=1 Tax=Sesamum latifolium TaxID=2727402 RepID=A0AAW2TGT2_9LAMI
MPAEWELSDDLPDEDVLVVEITPPWKMYFDGASHKEGAGAGVVFVTSEGEVLPYSFTLTQNCSNNMAEYQALIFGLEIDVDTKQRHLKVQSFEGIFLRCLSDDEKDQAMEEAHSDCIDYAKRCQACQFHANLIHQPLEPLHPTIASWPFDAWGLDVWAYDKVLWRSLIHFATTDYFSKWAEAVPLKEVKKENVADFIRTNIIYRYGVPRFKQRNSSMYYAAANGLAEAFNKTLCSLLKKVVAKSKRDWHERIGEALWAYRTTVRTPTQSTPYALVYGVEAVLPLEQQIPSLRIAIQEGLTEEENAHLRLEELEALDEKRLEAQQRLECYQARLSKAFNKKVRPRSFQVGDLVLAVRRPIITTHRMENKFLPKWDGPYVVKEAYTNGAYKLVAEDGLRIDPINGKFLKRYYA